MRSFRSAQFRDTFWLIFSPLHCRARWNHLWGGCWQSSTARHRDWRLSQSEASSWWRNNRDSYRKRLPTKLFLGEFEAIPHVSFLRICDDRAVLSYTVSRQSSPSRILLRHVLYFEHSIAGNDNIHRQRHNHDRKSRPCKNSLLIMCPLIGLKILHLWCSSTTIRHSWLS